MQPGRASVLCMLAVLQIKNLALVDTLSWEPGPGLVGVTGETGAGKSMIVGALKLVLGDRADRSLVRAGSGQCTVEALFEIPNALEVNAVLTEAGLDSCEDDQLVVRRIVAAAGTGGNRQFVNGSPVPLAVLRRLGTLLVDLHGPHEHQSLFSQDRQLHMIDAFGACQDALETYRRAYRTWRRLQRERDELRRSDGLSEQELELLRFQIREIDEAELRLDEEEPLEQRFRILRNHTRLLDTTRQLVDLFSENEVSVTSRLHEAGRALRELESVDPAARAFTAGFDTARVELEELSASLTRYLDGLEFDPAEQQAIEARLDILSGLKRKYGPSLEEVLAHREEAALRLGRVEGRGQALERLEAELASAEKNLHTAGAALRDQRRRAASRLAKQIAAQLVQVGFRQSRIEIRLEDASGPGPNGLDTADFIFAPNPGEPEQPLRLTASSGEMSRVMLALKSALADEDRIPLLVFDEIDANVGGEIARAVGGKMAELSRSHQVIAITHLPQVAAQAGSHFVVRKEVREGRTRSLLRRVEGAERVVELARMLGGDTASARAHAQTLLSG